MKTSRAKGRFQAGMKHGKKQSKISKEMKEVRTEHTVKNHFTSLKRENLRQWKKCLKKRKAKNGNGRMSLK